MKKHSIILKALWALAVIAYVVIFSEYFIRVMEPMPVMPRYVTAAPYGVRMNVPNRVYWQTTPETHIQFRINSQGMRADRDYAIEKPAGTCRVVMLGDSFFMGYEVDLKDSIQYRLEEELHKAGYSCEVINLAVSGMGPAESLIAFENVGKAFQPDLVVLETHRTNLDNNVRSGLFALKNGTLVQTGKQYLPGVRISDFLMRSPIYCWISENSQLYSAVREKSAALVKSLVVFLNTGVIDNSVGISTDEAGEKAMDEKRDLNRAIIERIEKEAKPAHLLMVEIPDRHTRFEYSSFYPIKAADNHFLATGQYVTVLNEIQQAARAGSVMYYEHGEGHMTPAGVDIVVGKLMQHILNVPEITKYHLRLPHDSTSGNRP